MSIQAKLRNIRYSNHEEGNGFFINYGLGLVWSSLFKIRHNQVVITELLLLPDTINPE